MKPREFISHLDEARIVAAITEAERNTSGEIRVYVSHKKREDALAAAHFRFRKLGMAKTRHRNAVLIYFAPLTHKFAIVGDLGIHEKCGDNYWQEIAGEMSDLLKEHLFTEAIITAIKKVGGVLAAHFPREPGDRNELPNQIAEG
jgi:uncharacterized membrane protein